MRIFVIFVILFFSSKSFANSCDSSNVMVYPDFISELKEQVNPIDKFNIKYLFAELKKIGLDEKEIPERVSKHMATLMTLHESNTVLAAYSTNVESCNHYIYKISNAPKGYGNYVSVSIVEGKMVGMSFEELDDIVKNTEITHIQSFVQM
jgi:hypothetical protein